MSLVQCNLSREHGSPKQAWLGVVLVLLGLWESFFFPLWAPVSSSVKWESAYPEGRVCR